MTATGTQAVDRAALLISTVVEATEPLAFAEIADECGLPKSTTSRLLTALERTELVERTAEGEYVAGPLFTRFASRHESQDLARLAVPVLHTVGEITGETVNLGMPRGETVVHVAQVDSRYLLGTRDWTTLEVPPHCSALGQALSAFGALAEPSTYPLEQRTEHTLTTRAELRAALDAVRVAGYAITRDELEIGLCGIAAPVHNGHGDVVAALGLSGPTPASKSTSRSGAVS
ncbi:MAG: IclR family transcriptional regulator [Nocardioides sp.]